MLVRTGRRARLLAFLAAVLAAGGVVAWAVTETYRPRERSELAATLQRLALERSILRAEYMLHREERPRSQWHEHTDRIRELLARYRTRAGSEGERQVLERLDQNLRESSELFGVIEGSAALAAGGRAIVEERATEDLLLLAFEQYEGATRLADEAAAAERGRERAILALVALVVLAAIAAVVAVAYVTSALLARRLARLEDGANRIAAGDLAHRIGMVGHDEIAAVARAFDAMAERVAAGVRALETSNRELEAFSYSVSHDLRTPLRHLTGFTDLLAEHAARSLDARGRHDLEVIREAALRMGRLIDDLLALSRLGRAVLAPGPVALRPHVDEVVAELGAAQRHAPEVRWDIGPLPTVVADPGLLRLVLTNLAGNALKFTRTRPVARIQIGARVEGDEVQVFVKDNGVGFDPDLADGLFGVFKRLHRADEFEGNGIGLANVRRIVQRHQGRVWAVGARDEGATFWFSLPRRDPPPR